MGLTDHECVAALNARAQARLYLVRHGETGWSLARRHTGRTESPLTARGEDEARRLTRRLQGIQFDHVLTSPRVRARRTCDLAELERNARIEPDLAEWDYGDFEGLRAEEIAEAHPDWSLFRDGCPRGETPLQATRRADRLIAHLRALGGNIALFSHGHFGCALAARWVGLPLVAAQHFQLDTASLNILGYDSHHPEVAVVALWNSVSLEALAPTPDSREIDASAMKQRAIERWENEGGEVLSIAPAAVV